MQAGVAMGLAKAVAVRFPDWGPEFVFLMVRLSAPPSFHRIEQNPPSFPFIMTDDVHIQTYSGILLQMSVIMINLFAGPPIFRSALISVGEARALQLPSIYGDVKSPK